MLLKLPLTIIFYIYECHRKDLHLLSHFVRLTLSYCGLCWQHYFPVRAEWSLGIEQSQTSFYPAVPRRLPPVAVGTTRYTSPCELQVRAPPRTVARIREARHREGDIKKVTRAAKRTKVPR
jgi:hypothetical protein